MVYYLNLKEREAHKEVHKEEEEEEEEEEEISCSAVKEVSMRG